MDFKEITVCEFNKCTGCMACTDLCPKSAVTVRDELMHFNAVIDTNKCIGCNRCHTLCQQNNPPMCALPAYWYQGWAEDPDVRAKGSSGGMAGAISSRFIENGGEVYSCCFENGRFVFSHATSYDDLNKFVGSKYVKSDPTGCYKEINAKLKNKHRILFIGLPCQVASLKNVVGSAGLESLYTIDLICHGTPSSKLLNIFLNQYGYSLNNLKDIKFRNKSKFQVCDGFNGIVTNGVSDRYIIAFLNSLTYTLNCYSCQYAKLERVSDITLGDSWGSELEKEQIEKGISLVLCMTEKGNDIVHESAVHLEKVDLDKAIHNNHQLKHPSVKPDKYDFFCNEIIKGVNFNRLVRRCLPISCFRQDIKRLLISLKMLGGYKL